MTKSQFAALVGRDPAFVSRAIGTGKIHGEALIGEGRKARIRVQPALAQLGRALDLSQQLAQARPIVPEAVLATGAAGAAQAPPPARAARQAEGLADEAVGELLLEAGEPVESGGGDALGSHRVAHIQLRNRKIALEVERAELERARVARQLVPAADVAAALRRQILPLVATFEEVPAAVAKTLAERFGLDYAETLIAVRECLRQQRAAWAERARDITPERISEAA